MRMRLFSAIAILTMAFGFAACSSSDDLSSDNNGKGDGANTSYLRVNLRDINTVNGAGAKKALTRATNDQGTANGTYEDGTTPEGYVGNVRFYFYTTDDNPYVLANCPTPGGNYIEHDFTGTSIGKDDTKTIESKTQALLVLNGTTERTLPTKVVAVVNFNDLTPALADGSMSLSTLKAVTSISSVIGSDRHFAMSNSVYPGTGTGSPVNLEQDITDNIKTTRDEAEKSAVDIYVERIAAKVTVDVTNQATTEPTITNNVSNWGTYDGKPAYQLGQINIYTTADRTNPVSYDLMAVVQGWGLADETENANLFKDITDWSNWAYKLGGLTSASADLSTLSPLWTVSDYKRCFWELTPTYKRKLWSWNDIFGSTSGSTATDPTKGTTFGDNNALYTLPNTPDKDATTFTSDADVNRRYTVDQTKADLTKVLVGAVLYCKPSTGTGSWQVARLVRYRGKYYLADNTNSEEKILKSLIAADYSYVYRDANCTQRINPSNVVIDPATSTGQKTDYQQTISLSGTADTLFYVKRDPTAAASTATIVHGGDKFSDYGDYVMSYTNGRSYYYTTIRHLWYPTADGSNPANNLGAFGVVRNHWYKITVNSLAGPGTPVPDPDKPIEPVTPQESLSYLTARINVLQWRVVNQTVNIDGQTISVGSAKKH